MAETGPLSVLSAKGYKVGHFFIIPNCQLRKLRHRVVDCLGHTTSTWQQRQDVDPTSQAPEPTLLITSLNSLSWNPRPKSPGMVDLPLASLPG